jgi:hypothetical protein
MELQMLVIFFAHFPLLNSAAGGVQKGIKDLSGRPAPPATPLSLGRAKKWRAL